MACTSLLCKSQPSLHVVVRSGTVLFVLMEEDRHPKTFLEPQPQCRDCFLRQ